MAHSIKANSSDFGLFAFRSTDPKVSLDTYKKNLIRDIEAHSVLFQMDLSDAVDAVRIAPRAPRQLTIRCKDNPYEVRFQPDSYGKIRNFELIHRYETENPGLLKRMANAVTSAVKGAFDAIVFLATLPFRVLAAVVKATVELVQVAVITAIALPLILACAIVATPAIIALSLAASVVALPVIGIGLILAAPVIIPVVIISSIL